MRFLTVAVLLTWLQTAAAQVPAFRAPRLWEAADADSELTGPVRVYAAGNGDLWLTAGFDWVNGEPVGQPARVRVFDGTIDPGFQAGVSANGDGIWGFVEEPDGRVLMAVFHSRACAILRLLPDGRPDPGWRIFTTLGFPRTLARDPDGRILVAISWYSGDWTEPDPAAFVSDEATVVRLLPDGTRDPGFQPPAISGGLNTLFAQPVVDTQGRIIIGGQFETVNGLDAVNVARLLPNGAHDSSFQPDIPWDGDSSFRNSVIRDLALQPDGKIVLAGRVRITDHTTSATELLLMRLDADGRMDANFERVTRSQAAASDLARGLELLPDGRMVIYAGGLRRFAANGALDGSFQSSNSGFSLGLARVADGRFALPAIAGIPGLAMFSAEGAQLTTLDQLSFGSTSAAIDMAILGGGDVLLGGPFTRANAEARHGLFRLSAGSGGPATQQPDLLGWHGGRRSDTTLLRNHALARLPDGGVAYLSTMHSATIASSQPGGVFSVLGKLQPDGTPDPSWHTTNSRTNQWITGVTDLTPTPAGGLILTRMSVQVAADIGSALVVRVLPDGLRDEAFEAPSALTQTLAAAERYTDGSINRLILGSLRLWPGHNGGYFCAQINTNGVQTLLKLDSGLAPLAGFGVPSLRQLSEQNTFPTVFNPQTASSEQIQMVSFGTSDLRDVLELPDGRVLVCGTFPDLAGLPDTALLARLSPNGTVDGSFRPPVFGSTRIRLENPNVLAMAIDGQQRIYVAGNFDRVNGQPARGLVRLLPDGNWDPGYQPPIESVSYPKLAEAGLILEDQSLWVSGSFRALDEKFPRPVWKLSTLSETWLTTPQLTPSGVFRVQAALAADQSYRFQRTVNLVTWDDLESLQGSGSEVTLEDTAPPAGGALYRLISP